MKKTLLVILISITLLTGCKNKEEKIDYSKYSFTNTRWIRDSGHDIETIRFNSDGSFTYSCACGNPVNDSDLCEKYTYNEDTQEIKLECFELTEETITSIKIVKQDDNNLHLDFNGEIREFKKEN